MSQLLTKCHAMSKPLLQRCAKKATPKAIAQMEEAFLESHTKEFQLEVLKIMARLHKIKVLASLYDTSLHYELRYKILELLRGFGKNHFAIDGIRNISLFDENSLLRDQARYALREITGNKVI